MGKLSCTYYFSDRHRVLVMVHLKYELQQQQQTKKEEKNGMKEKQQNFVFKILCAMKIYTIVQLILAVHSYILSRHPYNLMVYSHATGLLSFSIYFSVTINFKLGE